MSRFFTPALLLAVAGSVFVYNQRPDRQVVFPMLDRITIDPYVQGQITVGILVALGSIALVASIVGVLRERRTD